MPKLDYQLLDDAIAAHAQGDHLGGLHQTLAHLFPDHPAFDLTQGPFCFEQGSSRVTLTLADGEFSARVPLVRLTETSLTTAALRYLLSRMSAVGQLHEPRLYGNDVYLEFSDRLSMLHPHKIREVLRRMPVEADDNDDWMVAEFKCEPLDRGAVEPLTDDELVRATEAWRTHWREVKDLVSESQRRRSIFFLNEVTAFALNHIRSALPITGYWWARVVASAGRFNNTSEDASSREAELTKCASQMEQLTVEALSGSLGHAKYVISPRAEGTPKILGEYLETGDYIDTVNNLFNAGRYMDAAVAMIGTYHFLLAQFYWPPSVENMLREGVVASSGKSWREATAMLLAHSASLFDSTDDDDDESESDIAEDET